MGAPHGVGRPDVADLSRLVVDNIEAEAAGLPRRRTVVDPTGSVTRTPRTAAELTPGDAEAIGAIAAALERVAASGVAIAAAHARATARAHRQLAVDVRSLRGRADDLYRRAEAHGVGPILLGDGRAMAAWLESHPAEREAVEGLVLAAIQLRLEWVGVHDAFVGALLPLRRDWGVSDW